MTSSKGFALAVTLLFVLLLTLLGFSILVIAGSYYSSGRHLFEKENVRIACVQATTEMVDRHNQGPDPPFFFDPAHWNGKTMAPFQWNGYEINAHLDKPWSAVLPNLLTVKASKGPYHAERLLQLKQKRAEDYALYTDAVQSLEAIPLMDGLAFFRDGVDLSFPVARFRDVVQGEIRPLMNASLRRITYKTLDHPAVKDWLPTSAFQEMAESNGMMVTSRDPEFWKTDKYELILDDLSLNRAGSFWRIAYRGKVLKNVRSLHLFFDDTVSIRQTAAAQTFPPPAKIRMPLYVGSARDVHIFSSLQSFESSTAIHPLCLVAESKIRVDPDSPRAQWIEALAIAGGESVTNGVEIAPVSREATAAEQEMFRDKVRSSTFLVEESKRQALMQTLETGGRIVWFRGGLLLAKPISAPSDLRELHFQASQEAYPFLPSLPYVDIVEGSERWQQ